MDIEEEYFFCSHTCCFLAGFGNVREGVNQLKLIKLEDDYKKQVELRDNYPVRVRDKHPCSCHHTKEEIEEGRSY